MNKMNRISISKANEKEIESFNKKVWKEADLEHYGQGARWVSKEIIFKAVENGKIIGTVKAKYDSGVVYVKNVIIAKNKRGQGIGRQLMTRVEIAGKKLGAHKIYLFTGKTWPERKFYEKLGYKKTSDLPKHFFKHDFVIYSKTIRVGIIFKS
jgi:N-acetylglutamate synthase-like GNAT family acetyltransferase